MCVWFKHIKPVKKVAELFSLVHISFYKNHVYRRLFKFWLIFPNQNYQSRSKNIFSTNADIAHFLRGGKDSLSSNICSKHQEKQRRSSAVWRYRWLPRVLSKIVTTSSPGYRPRQVFPPSHLPDWSLNPLEETLLQPVLKSLITVFIITRS